MSNDADAYPSENPEAMIDIWGSCVSRDTLEFMTDFDTGTYVARQSAIVALAPATDLSAPLDELESDFQRRMLAGDTGADAGARLEAQRAACVLIDLVDERRGVWQLPNGTYLTNSVEAFRTGIDQWGPDMGARLIEFGTNEHFELWRQGFSLVTRRIRRTGKPIVLLDIAWAEVFEGQTPPHGLASLFSSVARRSQRMAGHFLRTVKNERSVVAGVTRLSAAPLTAGDGYVKVAREANDGYRRYIDTAQNHADVTIRRTADAVRMNKAHKWGVAPYHYSDHDYERIRDDIYRILRKA